MGSDDAVELLTDFYSDTTDLLFAMLGHARAGHDTKPDLYMNLMLTVAHTSYGLDNIVSFRVHAEAYLNFSADPVAARAAFDRAYQSRRAELTQRVRDVIAALDDPTAPPVPFVREWAALLARYRRRTSELLESGRMVLPEARPEEPRLGDIPILRRDPGELVRLIFTNPAYRETVFGSPAFQCYRVLLNFTYLHLTRMGLTPLDRFRLCHLTASAAEDTYNVSALDLIRRFTDAHPAPA